MKLNTNSILILFGILAFSIMACLPVTLIALPLLRPAQHNPVELDRDRSSDRHADPVRYDADAHPTHGDTHSAHQDACPHGNYVLRLGRFHHGCDGSRRDPVCSRGSVYQDLAPEEYWNLHVDSGL